MSKDYADNVFEVAKALLKLKANSEKLGTAITAYMEACKHSKKQGYNSLAVHMQIDACDECRAAFEDVLASSAVLALLSVEGDAAVEPESKG